MKIGIDARLIDETGVGRYIRNLIGHVSRIDRKNDYVLFLRKKAFGDFPLPNPRWKKVLADIRWHTIAEQLVMPGIFTHENLDILHVPYHNPPVFYAGKVILTIHDLTILHFGTGRATTLPKPVYFLKRLGYVAELTIGLRQAVHIITVSHATKREIMDHFRVPPEKITVTYEGVDERLTGDETGMKKRLVDSPYFLYVGNAYPHKNLETLLDAFATYTAQSEAPRARLVLVGQDDYFYRRLRERASLLGLTDAVTFFGAANDGQLANLYTHAVAFVFPSLMEGFGLPALEALSFGCRLIVSDISVFHEILGANAVYVDPLKPASLVRALKLASSRADNRSGPPESIHAFLKQYSWRSLSAETLSLYERSTRL